MKCPHCGKEADADPRFFVWFDRTKPLTETIDAIEHLKPWNWIWVNSSGLIPAPAELEAIAKAACPIGAKGASLMVYPGRVRLVSYYV
jgi:hypothetical protein